MRASSIKLLPCPCCGAKARFLSGTAELGSNQSRTACDMIECCVCSISTVWQEKRRDGRVILAREWNMRVVRQADFDAGGQKMVDAIADVFASMKDGKTKELCKAGLRMAIEAINARTAARG